MDTGSVQNREIRGVTGRKFTNRLSNSGRGGHYQLAKPLEGNTKVATWKARLFRITFSTISELQRWISVAAFAHDAVVRSISRGGGRAARSNTLRGGREGWRV